ncbi:GNAT family N-acetyltransferase [Clostridium sp. UBA6640]|uniref:GNAT family N-acetyltransferase n=1 Tax=Clostridium sp. UBA6640 TaxID=1946370 RepID=UPI0025B956F9|nr:GNAT family N-acetyltransferase [Clostridium sp. UBA6640]
MYKIRYANIDDAKVLGDIHSKSWKTAYKDIVPDEILNNITSEKRKISFEKILSEALEENILIFEEEEKAVGFMCIGKCRDEDKDDFCGEIVAMYLLPQYWNQGIGTKLITHGMNELINRNYKHITLWVLEGNVNARRFYEKIGFHHDGTVKEIYIGKKLNEYRYIKVVD